MKIAVITGASSGIGRETARQMADKGYKVYDLSRSDKPQEGIIHLPCDVTNRETITAAIQQITDTDGRIDVLVLCAGMGVAGSIEFTKEEEMQRQFDVNTYGPIRVVQAALPLMRTQPMLQQGERGRIVFVSSMAAVFGIPFQAMYSATKAAINSFAFSLKNELKAYQIAVSCVQPGDVKTSFGNARRTDLAGSDVYPNMQAAIQQMEHDEENGLSATACAKQVVKACTKKNPSLYYTSDLLSDLECLGNRLLPTWLATKVVGMMYHC
ncbi:MAG: SDR family oxidoreductase [Bacteroidaceae bacterium]|nr:SDR family oxidoreductase [Bacteroidaceae bacterium]